MVGGVVETSSRHFQSTGSPRRLYTYVSRKTAAACVHTLDTSAVRSQPCAPYDVFGSTLDGDGGRRVTLRAEIARRDEVEVEAEVTIKTAVIGCRARPRTGQLRTFRSCPIFYSSALLGRKGQPIITVRGGHSSLWPPVVIAIIIVAIGRPRHSSCSPGRSLAPDPNSECIRRGRHRGPMMSNRVVIRRPVNEASSPIATDNKAIQLSPLLCPVLCSSITCLRPVFMGGEPAEPDPLGREPLPVAARAYSTARFHLCASHQEPLLKPRVGGPTRLLVNQAVIMICQVAFDDLLKQ